MIKAGMTVYTPFVFYRAYNSHIQGAVYLSKYVSLVAYCICKNKDRAQSEKDTTDTILDQKIASPSTF